MSMDAWFAAVEGSRLAMAVSESLWVTGFLSAVHLVGMTVVTGGAVVSGLRLLDLLLTDRPLPDVASFVTRGMLVGLAVSLASGGLLVAPRMTAAVGNGYFQIKMGLLVAATLFHVAEFRRLAAGAPVRPIRRRASGTIGALLWLGVAAAGSAFILLE